MNKDQLKLIITITLISAISALGAFVGLLLLADQANAMDRNGALIEFFGDARGVDWTNEKVIDATEEVNSNAIIGAGEINALAGAPVIRILINSPGGSVMTGNMFIQAMELAKERGSRIDCVVTNLAASMAMHYLAHCDKRFVLQGAYLLFHEPRVGIMSPASPSELKHVYEALEAATYTLDKQLRAEIGASNEVYDYHNIAQTLWQVELFRATFPKFKLVIIKDVKVPKTLMQKAFNPIGAGINSVNLLYLPYEFVY